MSKSSKRSTRLRVTAGDKPDPWIVGVTVLLALIGCVFVLDTTFFYSQQYYGDGYSMALRQGAALIAGGGLAWMLSRCRSDRIERWAPGLFAGALLLTVLPLIPGIGHCAKGACRWIDAGPIRMQPSELAKVAFVAYLAATLTRKGTKLRDWRYGLLPTLAVTGVFAALLLKEPDFGTTVLVVALGCAMMFLAGVPLRHLLLVLVPAVAGAVALVHGDDIRLRRLLCFSDPWEDPTGACYQIVQSYRTFGSGGLAGIGIGASTQKAGWLPEAHTDYVFAVIGEEAGLIGATIVLLCFCLLAYRGFRVAHRHPESFGQLLAAGITLALVSQALFNMGVVLGLLPPKGLVLPFFSYGGSSLLITMAAMGVLMSLSRELRER